MAILATSFIIGSLVLGVIELTDKPNTIPIRSIIFMEIGFVLYAISAIVTICLHG